MRFLYNTTKFVFFIIITFISISYSVEFGSFFAECPDKSKRYISLTFDDGPGASTEKILEILKTYNIKATFFMQGLQIYLHPEIAKKVFQDGHEIGSHTWSHYNFYKYHGSDYTKLLMNDIEKTEEIFQKYFKFKPILLRMPHGYVKKWVRDIAKEKEYILINWSFGCDWKNIKKEDMLNHYIDNIKPGAIFLFHDGGKNREKTIYILPSLIKEIKKRGYEIVTVGEMIGININN